MDRKSIALVSMMCWCSASGLAAVSAQEVLAPPGLCEQVAAAENEHRLDSISLGGERIEDWVEIDSGPREVFTQEAYRADIDNDGRKDRVVFRRQEDWNASRLVVLDEAGSPIPLWSDALGMESRESLNNRAWAGLNLLEYKKRTFVVLSQHGGPGSNMWSYLAGVGYMTADHVLHIVCQFRIGKDRVRRVTSGQPDLCGRVMRGEVEHVKFDQPMPRVISANQGGTPELSLDTQSADFDIDNDGNVDAVGRMTSQAEISHDCDRVRFAVLNAERCRASRSDPKIRSCSGRPIVAWEIRWKRSFTKARHT